MIMLTIRIIYNLYFDTSGLVSGAARVTWSRHVTRAHAASQRRCRRAAPTRGQVHCGKGHSFMCINKSTETMFL